MLGKSPKEDGDRFFKQQNYTKAIEAYNIAIQKHPKDFKIRSNLSAAYAQLGDFEYALKCAQTCISINPSWAKG